MLNKFKAAKIDSVVKKIERDGKYYIWIMGKGFSPMHYYNCFLNYSNQVFLVNDITSYECEIQHARVTTTQIVCLIP